MKCIYCNSITKDLRPYGPNGSMICFSCAFSDDRRREETERNFISQLNACGAVAVIDGSEVGPYPENSSNHH